MTIQTTIQATRWSELTTYLVEQLNEVRKEEPQFLNFARRAILLCQQSLDSIRKSVQEQPPTSPAEDILYHKEIKPFFVGRILFYSRAFDIELARPTGGKKEIKRYFRNLLLQNREIFTEQHFIWQYLRSGQTFLDDRLFVSYPADTPAPSIDLGTPSEFAFPLGFDRIVSRIRAAELLATHLEGQLEELIRPGLAGTQAAPRVTWTESKTGLIELAYALQSAGVLNNGKIDLKDIIDLLSTAFNIQLGNYPRTFQEILSRKTGYTTLIDKLRDKLLLRIQRIEDKYIR